ncbi:hypothetical protein BH10BDE1_BH10BDE1_29290 [soil metagenome]
MILNTRDSISVLDPVNQGQTLTEKAVDVHVVDGEEMIARWFLSPNECDLMIWFRSTGELSRFQLNAAGQITDWCVVEGLQTGLIVEIEFAAPSVKPTAGRQPRAEVQYAETIQFDATLNIEAVRTARELISNASAVSKPAQLAMIEILGRNWPRVSKPRANASRTRFWGRFKRWTAGT